MMSILNKQFKRVKPVQVRRLPAPSLPAPRPTHILSAAAKPVTATKTLTARLTPIPEPTPDIVPQQWSIQVGSFSRRVSAHKAAISARRMAGAVLNRRPAQLSLVVQGQIPLWRVQFRKLDEDQARAACAALFSAGSACIALPEDVFGETS